MRKSILRTAFTFVFVGALALSGAVTQYTGMGQVKADSKLMQGACPQLNQVTGISFNDEEDEIFWNKVPNATRYRVTLTDVEGYTYSNWAYDPSIRYWNFEDEEWRKEIVDAEGDKETVYKYVSGLSGAYTVTVTPVDGTGYYFAETNLTWAQVQDKYYSLPNFWDFYDYDSIQDASGNSIYTVYQHPTGPAAAANINVLSDVKQIVEGTVTALPGVAKKEASKSSVTFKLTSKVNLNEGEWIQWQQSNNPQFINDSKTGQYASSWNYETDDDEDYDKNYGTEFSVGYYEFLPGETIYVRARVYNENFKKVVVQEEDWSWSYYDGAFGAYTGAVSYAVPKFEMGNVDLSVNATSVKLMADVESGVATGYQFAKKVGKKWVTLETQTDPTFIDKGLAKDTAYTYRVRAYYYNKNTRKTSWSEWKTVKATTWGSNMNLKAAASSSTSVKLTWKKVVGAEGYEVYRSETYSGLSVSEKGIGLEDFSTFTLIKTLKGSKKNSYTNKKLTKGETYTYLVRAYKTFGKQKVYMDSWAGVSLEAGALNATSYVNSKGQTVVTWSKMTGIKGYYVERYNDATDEYEVIKKLKSSATSYTFAKVNYGESSVNYRIRPYSSKYVYEGQEVNVGPSIATVTGVKAVKEGNGIKVTWKPVAGADYYRVYRTTNSNYNYDKTTKTYDYTTGDTVYEGAVNTANCYPELESGYAQGYREMGTYTTDAIRGTEVYDTALTYVRRAYNENGEPIVIGTTPDGKKVYQTEEAFYDGIEGPEAGTTYYYYVVAYAKTPNGGLNDGSAVSVGDSKAAKIEYTNAVANKKVKKVSVSSKKKGQVTVSFKRVKGVTGYAIYRSTKKNGTYVMIGTSVSKKKTIAFTDASAKSGKKYYYKVATFVKGERQANIYSAKSKASKSVKVK